MFEIKETDKVFIDSPDAGDPDCLCSRCGKLIQEGECPLRAFDPENNTECRFCHSCMKAAGMAISEPIEFTNQDFYNEIMGEINAELTELESKHRRDKARIMRAIRNQVGKGFADDLERLIGEESGYCQYVLVRSPGGKFQQEADFGCITGVWVYQTGSADYGYSGECWVKLKNNLYLQFHFAGE